MSAARSLSHVYPCDEVVICPVCAFPALVSPPAVCAYCDPEQSRADLMNDCSTAISSLLNEMRNMKKCFHGQIQIQSPRVSIGRQNQSCVLSVDAKLRCENS